MSWQQEVDEIARRKQLAARIGGSEAVAKMHSAGKFTARERIERCQQSY